MLKRLKNFVTVLQNRAEETPHHLAALYLEDGINETTGITYRELDVKARAVGSYLQSQHLFAKQVLLAFPTGIDFIIAFVGCLYAGVVAIPISLSALGNPEKNHELIGRIAKNAEISGVLTSAKYLEQVEEICAQYMENRVLFVTDSTQFEIRQADDFHSPDLTGENSVYLQYTSGSTSSPKAVIVRHKNLFHSLTANAKVWHYKKNSISLTWTSHAHVFGLVCGIMLPLFCGNLTVIVPPEVFLRRPLSWLEAISKYRVTHSGAPNFAYDLCIEQIKDDELQGLNLKNWKVAINGGERVRSETLVNFAKKFSPIGFSLDHFCSAYGMSEVTGTIAASRYGKRPQEIILDKDALKENKVINVQSNIPHNKFISSGRLLLGLKALIVDPETSSPVDDKNIGEIWLAGQSLVSGYWRNSEATQSAFAVTSTNNSNDKYFRTGDLGFIYKNEIFITGRVSEVINIYGKKYYPVDLEQSVAAALKTIAGLGKQIVFTDPHDVADTIVFIQEIEICLKEMDFDAIVKAIRKTTTEQHGVDLDAVVLVSSGSLAVTLSGKLQRSVIKQLYVANKLPIIYQNKKQLEKAEVAIKDSFSAEPRYEANDPKVIYQTGDIVEHDQLIIEMLRHLFHADFAKIIAAALQINSTEVNFSYAMSAYGFDSLNIVKLTNELNTTFKLTINPSILYQYSTLEEFITDIIKHNLANLIAHYYVSLYPENGLPPGLALSVAEPDKILDQSFSVPKGKISPGRENIDIAIIGMHGVFPGAGDLNTFWNNLISGVDPICVIPESRWSWKTYFGDPQTSQSKTNIKWGGFVDSMAEFDAAFFNISPREAELMDPQQRLFLQVVWKAIEEAGYSTTELTKFMIGLYVGVFNNDYAELLQKNAITDAYVTTGITHSTLANRVSYLLNFHGPSEAIDTACSSSLVAVHHAIQAINSGDCQVAIAGGVNALLSPNIYISANKAGMLCEDGRCKTFDKSANGYVRAEGAAAVLLRPLKDAIQAGDHIYAVIKGSAVNHGGHVSSLTVPNPNAQAEVIIAACKRAEIAIDTVSYIETHGTGTALGDPIEINGLKKAFSLLNERENLNSVPNKINYCGLGAVKSNIGHLESAAGMAGLIKVILAMQNNYLPANLHFEELNPYIEIENSPFYLVTKNKPWERSKNSEDIDVPLRAGISSFGFGGTNAHIILESVSSIVDYPAVIKPYCIIALAAKTPIALQQKMLDLLAWIENQFLPINLFTLSFTLNVGRNHYEERVAFVVNSVVELKNSLIQATTGKILSVYDLSQEDKISAETINPILAELSSSALNTKDYHHRLERVKDYYLRGFDVNWLKLYENNRCQRISLPTYPFAKTSYWLPKNSSLVENYKINNQDLKQRLFDSIDYSLEKINFTKLFSGNEFYLQNHQINDHKILPGAVIIEMIMEAGALAVKDRYVIGLKNIKWLKPFSFPEQQTLTLSIFKEGDDVRFIAISQVENINILHAEGFINYAKASDPSIEANNWHLNLETIKKRCAKEVNVDDFYQLRRSQGYAYGDSLKSITCLFYNEKEALALLKLPLENTEQNEWKLHPSLLDGALQTIACLVTDSESLLPYAMTDLTVLKPLTTPCYVYVQKIADNLFNVVLLNDKRQICLKAHKIALAAVNHSIYKNCYQVEWQQKNIPPRIQPHSAANVLILYLKHAEVYKDRILAAYSGSNIVAVRLDEISLDADFISKNFAQLEEIYFLGSLKVPIQIQTDAAKYKASENYGVMALFHLCKALHHLGYASQALTWKIITNNSYAIREEAIFASSASILGFCKSMAKEYLAWNISCYDIDWDELQVNPQLVNDTFSIILNGSSNRSANEIVLRQGLRYQKVIKPVQLKQTERDPSWKKKGVYLIAGGAGGIGFAYSLFLASELQARLVWVGRRPKNEIIAKQCAAIEAKGGEVVYFSADMANELAMREVVAKAQNHFGQIHGVIHAAMILKDKTIAQMSEDDFHAAFDPKVYGSIILYQIFSTYPLDFMLLFSSMQSFDGQAGQSNYAAGSAFEDAFASTIRKKALFPVKVINWGYFGSVGAVATDYYKNRLAEQGIYSLNPVECFKLLSSFVSDDLQQILVIDADSSVIQKMMSYDDVINERQDATFKPIQDGKKSADINRDILALLKNIFAESLKQAVDQLEVDVKYDRYGIDSLSIMDINRKLSAIFGKVPDTLLYEYQTINALAQYFLQNHSELLIKMFSAPTPVIADVVAGHDPASFTTNIDINTEYAEYQDDIAIIGLSGVYPRAINLFQYWQNLKNGMDCVTEIPANRWDWQAYAGEKQNKDGTSYNRWGGFIEDFDKFDPQFFNISPKDAELMDPQERLFLQTAYTVLEDAGYTEKMLAEFSSKTGVFVGVMNSDYEWVAAQAYLTQHDVGANAHHWSIANRVSYYFNFNGPSITVNTACSSSLTAIHLACESLLCGESELAIAGGVNLILHPLHYAKLSQMEMLSSDKTCKAFGENADGFIDGEGVGAVLLKPLADALKDGDQIYGVIKGSAINHGGKTHGYMVPNPNVQADVIKTALQRAKINPRSISYIEAHGTGTALGDPIEIVGLDQAFSAYTADKQFCALGSVKSNIGHLESAAGIAALTKVLLQLRYKMLVPTLHATTSNHSIDFTNTSFHLQQQLTQWEASQFEVEGKTVAFPLRAGISSFGAGGANAHMVIEQAPKINITSHENKLKPFYLIALSAKSKQSLLDNIKSLHSYLGAESLEHTLAAISMTLNIYRNHYNIRCAFVVDSVASLIAQLEEMIQGKQTTDFISNTNLSYSEFAEKILSEIKNENLSVKEYQENLLLLANIYIKGGEINWNALHENEVRQRISLPSYAFEKQRYWVENSPVKAPSQRSVEKYALEEAEKIPVLTASSNEIQDKICSCLASIIKANKAAIDLKKSFFELGCDSIDLKELTIQLEKHYSFELNPAIFFTYNNIFDLSQYLFETYGSVFNTNPPLYASNEKIKIIASDYLHEPIAVIGMQGIFPQSKDLNIFWEHLAAGHDLITEVPPSHWDWRAIYSDNPTTKNKSISKWGSFIPDFDSFDAEFFNISAREANYMDPQQRLMLEIVWKAIEDAGYDPLALHTQTTGLFMGVEFSEYLALLRTKPELTSGYITTGNSHAMLANRISYFLNLTGPSEVIDTACSSSLVAVHRAVSALRNNECKVAIAGGVSLILDPQTYIVTSQLGVLSPDGRCKTFDKAANGYVKGEGVAAVILKPLSQAKADGDHIYAIIKGSAVNHGGKAQSLTAPNAAAQSKLLQTVYQEANIDPQTVSYIEVHGTGTELGDPVEIEGLKLAFNTLSTNKLAAVSPYCGLGSVKTNMGHLEPASGIAGLIKVLLAMQKEVIPATLHQKELNPYINLANTPFYIVNKTQAWTRLLDSTGHEVPRRAGISSFGFGGTNAHIVLEEFSAPQNKAKNSRHSAYLFTLSTKNPDSLLQKIIDLKQWLLSQKEDIDLLALSYTLNCGRSHFDNRCAFIAADYAELITTLTLLLEQQSADNALINYGEQLNLKGPVLKSIYDNCLSLIGNDASINLEDYRGQLFLLADLYCKKYPVDLTKIYVNSNTKRIAGLPNYPLVKARYWYDQELKNQLPTPAEFKAANLNSSTPPVTNQKVDVKKFLTRYLQKIFADVLRIAPNKININSTYELYGVDSITGLEITNRLESDFGELSKTLLYERNQLSDLADYFIKSHNNAVLNLAKHLNLNTEQDLGQPNHSNLSIPQAVSITPAIEMPMNIMPSEDIAIIGLSGIYPMAKDLAEFWDNLTAGKDCISEVPIERWNYKDYPVQQGKETKYYSAGGFIPDIDKFDPLFFNIAPRDAATMDPQERLFLQCAWHVLEDSGYTREKLRRIADNKVGVFAGATYNFYPLFLAEEWFKGNRQALDFQMFSIANRVSYHLNLNGPSYPIDTACSSSLAAIHLAYESIMRGECIMAIAGGVNLSLHPTKYYMLGAMNFMSEQGRCASFAEGGSGYVPGEGVGAVLLKPLTLAQRDNDRIYAVIKGSAMNHGGKTSGYTVPNPNAQASLIKDALAKAKINPRSISYIEAHGTGTSLGDPIEVRGLQQAFEEYTEDKQFCAIGSVKSNIGHLESAAGISQLTKVILQLQHKKLVPSLHAEKLNPFIDFANSAFVVQRKLSDWERNGEHPLRAGVSSFGAGGTNVHLIVEEFVEPALQSPAVKTVNLPLIFLLSAQNQERLLEYVKRFIAYFVQHKEIIPANQMKLWLQNVCYTLQTGREVMSVKLAILAEDLEELQQQLNNYIANPKSQGAKLLVSDDKMVESQDSIDEAKINSFLQSAAYENLIKAWVEGNPVVWDMLYQETKPRILSVPNYPFAQRHCWITKTPLNNIAPSEQVEEMKSEPVSTNTLDLYSQAIKKVGESIAIPKNVAESEELDDCESWLYQQVWAVKPLTPVTQISQDNKQWLIFSDFEQGYLLQDELGKENCIYCFKSEDYQVYDKRVYYIDANKFENYHRIFAQLKSDNTSLQGIIYLWSADASAIDNKQMDLYANFASDEHSLQLVYLFKVLQEQAFNYSIPFCLITRNAQAVNVNEAIDVWHHHFWTLTRFFNAEQKQFVIQMLDLPAKKNLRDDAKIIVAEIKNLQETENQLAYRDNQRYVLQLKSAKQLVTPNVVTPPQTALITGGLGVLGFEIAKALIDQGTLDILLLGSTVLPERSEWSQINDENLQEKITHLQNLEKLPAKVIYKAVDVRDKNNLSHCIEAVEQTWQRPITGVFHLAGITTDNVPITSMTDDLYREVLLVKIQGALALHEIFKTRSLDCFVLFSSIAAVPYFGVNGLSAYGTANDFLNGLANYRRFLGLPAVSINWCAWTGKGMSLKHDHSAFLKAVGMDSLSTETGLKLCKYLLNPVLANVTVMAIQWDKFFKINPAAKKQAFFTLFNDQADTLVEKESSLNYSRAEIFKIVLSVFAACLSLSVDEVNSQDLLQNYGLDSIIGINFISQLNEHFADFLTPMDLYRYTTINQLTDYISQKFTASNIPQVKPKNENIQNMTAIELNNLLEQELLDLNDLL